ncbi:MAG: hypothetical protein GY718_19965 [Lentisphaerae bacterium]|nr:hypothetical protein [Lentisphaerota bacterium]
MPSYSVAVPDIVAGGDPQTLINIFSVAGVSRGKIDNVIVSSGATPDDQAANYEMLRTTGIGTEGSGKTPNPTDPDTVASSFDAGYGHSIEPTETADSELLVFSVNQRATFEWLANPGKELIMPATTNNGISLVRRTSTGVYVIDATIIFEE